MFPLRLIAAIAVAIAAFSLLPTSVAVLLGFGTATVAGLTAALVRRDSGPRFRAPVFIGR